MAKQRLYYVTNGFPFSKTESTFVTPELLRLRDEFDVTLIAPKVDPRASLVCELPPEVSLVEYDPRGRLVKFLYGLTMFVSKSGVREIGRLFRDGYSNRRLVDCLREWGAAVHFRNFLRRNGFFNRCDEALFYSFWFDARCLGIGLQKLVDPEIRLVARIHRYDLYNEANDLGRQPFQCEIAGLVDKLLFISRQGMEYFEDAFCAERFSGQYELNYLGVSGQGDVNLGELDSALCFSAGTHPLFVSCSRVVPVKNLEAVVEALAAYRERYPDSVKPKWVHFGDGELLSELQAKAEACEVDCYTPGYTTNGTVVEFLCRARPDAFINVSKSEGLPVSVLEALSAGVPIIVSDVGGNAEAFNENGLILNEQPLPSEIADAMHELATAPEKEKERMRVNSRVHWQEKFSIESNKDALVRILSSISMN